MASQHELKKLKELIPSLKSDDSILLKWIDDAQTVVDNNLSSEEIQSEAKDEIKFLLAAHIATQMADEISKIALDVASNQINSTFSKALKGSKSLKFKPSKQTVQKKLGKNDVITVSLNFKSTRFGLEACKIDTSGTLSKMEKISVEVHIK